jgi:hypothetical protein
MSQASKQDYSYHSYSLHTQPTLIYIILFTVCGAIRGVSGCLLSTGASKYEHQLNNCDVSHLQNGKLYKASTQLLSIPAIP